MEKKTIYIVTYADNEQELSVNPFETEEEANAFMKKQYEDYMEDGDGLEDCCFINEDSDAFYENEDEDFWCQWRIDCYSL